MLFILLWDSFASCEAHLTALHPVVENSIGRRLGNHILPEFVIASKQCGRRFALEWLDGAVPMRIRCFMCLL